MQFLEVGHRAAAALASAPAEVLMEFSRGAVWRCGNAIVWVDCDAEAFSPWGARPACGHTHRDESGGRAAALQGAFDDAVAQFRITRDPQPLIGLGHGLTPSGDDFLGGYFLVRHRRGHRDVIDTSATHEISRARLAMHMIGEGTRAEMRFVDALLHADDVDAAAAILRRHGHSSGDDFMRGARAALELQ